VATQIPELGGHKISLPQWNIFVGIQITVWGRFVIVSRDCPRNSKHLIAITLTAFHPWQQTQPKLRTDEANQQTHFYQ